MDLSQDLIDQLGGLALQIFLSRLTEPIFPCQRDSERKRLPEPFPSSQDTYLGAIVGTECNVDDRLTLAIKVYIYIIYIPPLLTQ